MTAALPEVLAARLCRWQDAARWGVDLGKWGLTPVLRRNTLGVRMSLARKCVTLAALCGAFVATASPISATMTAVDGRATGVGASVSDFGSLQLGLVQVAGGLSQPVAVAWRHSDPRMYVVEKVGRVRLVNTNGSLVSQPVLDLTGSVAQGAEQGLLGSTFSPDGTTLYVDYTDTTGRIEVDRVHDVG